MAQQRLLKLDENGKPFTGNDVGPNGELRYYKNGRLLEGIGGAAQMLQGGFEDFVEPLVDGGKNYWNRQTRLTNEAFKRNETKPNINEYFNSILQERWDSAVTEDDKASVRDLLAAFNVKEEKDIIQSETGAAPTSVIPETFTDYRRRTAGQRAEDKVIESNADEKNNELNTNVIPTEEDKIDEINNKPPTTLSAGYQRPSPAERQKARMEEILVRGRPGEKFKLDRERGRGTNVDDLFTKNREK
tara:strand:+ start:45 stop:779 length:735 start_codon:yes stop_codon:yes gene_type:complete